MRTNEFSYVTMTFWLFGMSPLLFLCHMMLLMTNWCRLRSVSSVMTSKPREEM